MPSATVSGDTVSIGNAAELSEQRCAGRVKLFSAFPRILHTRQAGFTLVEVLVALVIVAVSLIAGLRASAGMQRQAEREQQVTLAKWCIASTLSDFRLARQLPPLGPQESTCTQAGVTLTSHIQVNPTPNARFRRVDVLMQDDRHEPVLSLTSVVGFP